MVRHISIVLAVCCLIACKQKQKEITPENKVLVEAVYASGNLISENDYRLVSTGDGYLANTFVKEGDAVAANQVLFSLNSSTRNTQMQSAEELLQKTRPLTDANSPAISDLKNKTGLAQIKLSIDSLNYVRYKNLYNNNATTQSQLEVTELKYKTSVMELSGLQKQLAQAQLNAALTLQQSQNQLNLARNEVGNTQLKSLTSGTVFEIYKNPGDLIMPGQAVALIGSGKLIARLSIDETDMSKIKIGQQVLITMDAYPEKVFKAKLSKIYPALNRVEQSIKVDAQFEDALPANYYGLNLEANIVVNEAKSVLAIPKKVLLKGDSVWVKTADGKQKVKIKKGAEDKESVEVLSGINSSSIIIESL